MSPAEPSRAHLRFPSTPAHPVALYRHDGGEGLLVRFVPRYVLAGTQEEADAWRRRMVLPASAVFAPETPEALMGSRFAPEQLAVVGTFWDREDASRFWGVAQSAVLADDWQGGLPDLDTPGLLGRRFDSCAQLEERLEAASRPQDHGGRTAYEAYVADAGGRSLATGDELPAWHALPYAIRCAWCAAADAVVADWRAPLEED